MKNKRTLYGVTVSLLGLVLLLTGFGCSRLKIQKPAGFAEVIHKSNIYKAVSPEGIAYKVRTVKNYPPMSLDFWSAALKNHLQEEGYLLLTDSETIPATRNQGIYCEWGVPYAEKNYVYLTALFVKDKQIIIAEAGAEYNLYTKYKDSLLTSLKESTF